MPQALFKQSSSLPDLVVDESSPGTRRASPVVQLAKGVETSKNRKEREKMNCFPSYKSLKDIASYLDKQLQQLDR